MMSHYLVNFLITTVGLILFLLGLLIYIKQHPQFSGMAQPGKRPTQKPLKVHAALTLEPRKRLYVVGYGEQRFLVATGTDKTELIATLAPEEEVILETSAEADTPSDGSSQALPLGNLSQAGWGERFRTSLRMVLTERFMR